MNNYKIFETDEFIKTSGKISVPDRKFISGKLSKHIYPQLREEPHYGKNIKKLKDYKPETWRYRIGDYRVFCAIDENEKIVYLLTLDKGKDAY